MLLNVPLVRQDEDSEVCVLASLCMILAYHGRPVSIAELEHDADAGNIVMGAVGTYLMKRGFGVEVVIFHPRLCTLSDMERDPGSQVRLFRDRIGDPTNMEQDDRILTWLVTFTEQGGKVSIRIPTEQDIEAEIAAGRPLLVASDTNFLYWDRGQRFTHANAITGIDEKSIYVNDPMWDGRGGKHRHGRREYMFGIHAATHGTFNDGSLMKITPPTGQPIGDRLLTPERAPSGPTGPQ